MHRQPRLAAEGSVPQVGVALAIDAGGAADDVLVIFGDKQPRGIRPHRLAEELVVGNVALGLQPVVLAQQLGEGCEVGLALHLAGGHPLGIGIVDAVLHLLADALLRCAAVQRVVDAHPVYGEVALLPEVAVAKHLLRQVAHLEVEHRLVEPLGDGLQHLAVELVATVVALGIMALAQDSAVIEEEWWKERGAVAHNGQHLAHHAAAVVGTYRHIGPHPGRPRTDGKQLAAMEEILFADIGQFLQAGVYGCLDSFHAANIRKKKQIMSFFAEKNINPC